MLSFEKKTESFFYPYFTFVGMSFLFIIQSQMLNFPMTVYYNFFHFFYANFVCHLPIQSVFFLLYLFYSVTRNLSLYTKFYSTKNLFFYVGILCIFVCQPTLILFAITFITRCLLNCIQLIARNYLIYLLDRLNKTNKFWSHRNLSCK